MVSGVSFGTYHALVIGNNAYANLPNLRTARGDATAIAQVLEQRYGFDATLLLDADGNHFGDNTDGAGLVRDLRHNYHAEIAGRRVLLVGAGGAARGGRGE